MSKSQDKKGLYSFAMAMIASVFSNTGTNMTHFAIIAWAYETTGSAAAAGLLGMVSYGSLIVASIFAGAFVDRMSRKALIILTDVLTLLATAGFLVLFYADLLSIWYVAVYGAVRGIVASVQFPAYLSSITAMVSEDQRSRANGMYQTAWSLSATISPAVAGIVYAAVGLQGVLWLDLASFVIIIGAIAVLKIPNPPNSGPKGTILSESIDGFKYLFTRWSLLGFVLVLTSFNVAYGTYEGLYRPMLLAFTENNTQIAGWALAGWGIGNVVSGVFMTIWKGPKNRVPITLIAWALCGTFGFLVGGLGRSLPIWFLGGFFQGVFNNIAIIFTYGIWQSKIDPAYQGRAFSIIKLVSQVTIPVSVFAATMLADYVATPAFSEGGSLVSSLGGLFGTGSGAGMSFVLVVLGGLFGVIIPLLMFLSPTIRSADKKDPEPVAAEAATGAQA